MEKAVSKKKDPYIIWVVDDCAEVCEAVKQGLSQNGYEVRCFGDGETCLKRLRRERLDLLITDYRLPRMDGLALLRQARQAAPFLPVMVVTGYGDIPLPVKAMRAGAIDVLEKPLDLKAIISRVEEALDATGSVGRRHETLSKCEVRILRLVYQGMTNAEIAAKLHRSHRTIEDHRNHLMHKLRVHNLVELIKVAGKIGYDDEPEPKRVGGRRSPVRHRQLLRERTPS